MTLAALFDGVDALGEVALTTVAAYAAVIAVLRTSGKRTLAKLNAFDFVVTIAIGSTLASTIVSRSVPLVEGVVAFALLAALQYVVARISRRWPWARRVVTSSPSALVLGGVVQSEQLARSRVTEEELVTEIRKHGVSSIGDAAYVILETDGTFTVLTDAGDGSVLRGVPDLPRVHGRDDERTRRPPG